MAELRDKTVSHDWLWQFNPVFDSYLPKDEYAMAVRIRLGAFLTDEACICPRCNDEVMSRTASHALCCASSEGIHGHYTTRDAILQLTHLADPNASTEVPELISSAPVLRPADIYSSAAVPGSMAALDVGICSPDASGAGLDCCDTMWRKKRDRYAAYHEEMRYRGIVYCPLVISYYGRWHDDSFGIFDRIAIQACRRLGIQGYRGLVRRSHASVGVAIWRRAVVMARACLPRLDADELGLLFGDAAS